MPTVAPLGKRRSCAPALEESQLLLLLLLFIYLFINTATRKNPKNERSISTSSQPKLLMQNCDWFNNIIAAFPALVEMGLAMAVHALQILHRIWYERIWMMNECCRLYVLVVVKSYTCSIRTSRFHFNAHSLLSWRVIIWTSLQIAYHFR